MTHFIHVCVCGVLPRSGAVVGALRGPVHNIPRAQDEASTGFKYVIQFRI